MDSAHDRPATEPPAASPLHGGDGAASQPSGRRLWVKRIVYLLLTAAVVYFVGRAMAIQAAKIDWSQFHPNIALLLAGLAVMAAYTLVYGLTLWLLLRSLDRTVPVGRGVGIFLVAALGRYVPGKVAAVAGAAWMLARAGVSLPLGVGVVFVHAVLTSVLGLAFGSLAMLNQTGQEMVPLWGVWIGLGIAVCLVALYPPAFIAAVNMALRLVRRAPIEHRPERGPLLAAIALVVVRYVGLGTTAWLMAAAVLGAPAGQWWLFMAAATVAQVAGFVAFFAPAGVGVREGVYLLMLGPVIGMEWATLTALLLRLAQVVVDAAAGLLGTWLVRRRAGLPAAQATLDGEAPPR